MAVDRIPDIPNPDPAHRPVSDREREHLVRQLTGHVGAGRLTIDEFDRRAAAVYAATTLAEARATLADLPTPTPATPADPPAPVRPRRRLPVHQRIEWSAWAGVGALNVLIWALVCLGTMSLVYPWPIWVVGPWGLVLLARTVSGVERGGCAARPHARRGPAHHPSALAAGR